MSLRLVPTPGAPEVARAQVAARRADLGQRFDDVALMVSELVTNSVRHAHGTDEIRVSVTLANARIRLEVTDDGPCFERAGPPPSGAGLRLIEEIADDWGVIRDGRCTVWVEIGARG